MRSSTKISVAVVAFLLFFGSAGAVAAHTGFMPKNTSQASQASADAPSGRRITYSVSRQHVSLFAADGRRVRSYEVSGREGVPRPGTYHVFSKSRVSSSGSLRLDYMVRFVPGELAIGFHAIPVTEDGTPIQSEAELGQYRSHGCVRQAPDDAAFLYNWTPIGTPVVVTP